MRTMKTRMCMLAALLLLTVQAVFSQSLSDAQKDLYYQRYQTAKKSLQQLVSSKPDANTYYYLGLADMGLDDNNAAKADFQKGLQVDPNSALNYVGMGRIAIAVDKNYTEAKQAFQKAWDLSKGRDFDVVRAILQATALSPKADAQYALDLVEQFKNDRKNRRYELTAEDYTAIGNVYANLPDGGGKAATNYETAEAKDPKYAAAFNAEGDLWDRARQDSLALQDWNNAVAADPGYAPAFYQLGTYYRYRDLSKAQEYLNKYMALSDDPLNAKVNLVDILYLQGNFKQAVEQANDLMNQPVSAATKTRLYKLIAYSDLSEGDSLDAKKNMDTYFKLQDPDKVLPQDYKFYADVLGKLNQDSLQLVYLNKFVNTDTSTNLEFIREEAKKLSGEQNFKAANLWYDKLFKVADTSQLTMADYYYRAFTEYGAAVKGLGSYDKALETWQAFTKRYPDQPSGLYYIGTIQKAQDTTYKGTAIPAFNKYISMLKPDELKSSEKKAVLEIIYSYEAGCYATQGQDDKLNEALQKLLGVNPQSTVAANIFANQGYKAAQAKDFEKATALCNKALQVNPGNSTATQVLNYIQQMKAYDAKLKKYEEAKKKSGQ